jgi:uncharacterized protein YciI
MLYMIYGEDIPGSLERRMAVRPAHLERVAALQSAGRLVVGGPLPAIDSNDPGPAGFTGSLLIAEFDSLESAQSWAEGDPYMTSGVFARVTVKPFKQVFPQ